MKVLSGVRNGIHSYIVKKTRPAIGPEARSRPAYFKSIPTPPDSLTNKLRLVVGHTKYPCGPFKIFRDNEVKVNQIWLKNSISEMPGSGPAVNRCGENAHPRMEVAPLMKYSAYFSHTIVIIKIQATVSRPRHT